MRGFLERRNFLPREAHELCALLGAVIEIRTGVLGRIVEVIGKCDGRWAVATVRKCPERDDLLWYELHLLADEPEYSAKLLPLN